MAQEPRALAAVLYCDDSYPELLNALFDIGTMGDVAAALSPPRGQPRGGAVVDNDEHMREDVVDPAVDSPRGPFE